MTKWGKLVGKVGALGTLGLIIVASYNFAKHQAPVQAATVASASSDLPSTQDASPSPPTGRLSSAQVDSGPVDPMHTQLQCEHDAEKMLYACQTEQQTQQQSDLDAGRAPHANDCGAPYQEAMTVCSNNRVEDDRRHSGLASLNTNSE